MSDPLFIQLGKFGDVMNILPLFHYYAQTESVKMKLMISRDYASLLDGVSYVDPVIFDGGFMELGRAVKEARTLSGYVRSLQIAGPLDDVKKFTFIPAGISETKSDSFAKETWRVAGRLDLWNEQAPLVFDQRDEDREAALRKQVFGQYRKPPILIALSGETSPFPYGNLLIELVTLKFGRERKVIDISHLRAERLYDLLGLYEHAHCLIASDSAPLHLSHACPNLPVVALTNHKPSYWHGSPWRTNHVFYCRYEDWIGRSLEMLQAIESVTAVVRPASPIVIHTWNNYQNAPCGESWKHSRNVPATLGMFGRDSHTKINDDRRFPYLKDVLRMASWHARNDDVICLTRPGIDFFGSPKWLPEDSPCWAHRSAPTERGPVYHPAADLFAFTKAFYMEHRKELPDLILGNDQWWSRVMQHWIKKHGGKELAFAVTRDAKSTPEPNSARKSHNEKLAKQWFQEHQISLAPPKAVEQIPGVTLNRRALSPFGYNGSLIEHQGKLLLAYRWHRDSAKATVLAIAELDAKYNVIHNKGVAITGASIEDPRLFLHQGEVWVSYIESNYPEHPLFCVTKYGRLVNAGKEWRIDGQFQVAHGKNDGTAMEKNWLFFERGTDLFAIYKTDAQQSVIQVQENHVQNVFHSEAPHWAWGEIKGGAIAGEYQGHLLRFFHSRLDNEPRPWGHRYYIGAALMKPEPPFETVALSREPIVRASEDDDLSVIERSNCPHHKPKVAFPMGCIERENEWHLSIGVNDSACAVLKVKPEHLKL